MTANLPKINYFHLLGYIENKEKETCISSNKSIREKPCKLAIYFLTGHKLLHPEQLTVGGLEGRDFSSESKSVFSTCMCSINIC